MDTCKIFYLMLNFDPWSHFNVEKMNWDHMLMLKIDHVVRKNIGRTENLNN